MSKLLSLLDQQIAIFESGGSPDYELISSIVLYLKEWSDRWHHPKEDLIMDKLRLRDPAAAEKVGELEEDHHALAVLTDQFLALIGEVLNEEELPRDRVSQLATRFVQSQRGHMKGEEAVFLPAAERSLTTEDWAEIAMRIANPEDPLFGRTVEKRFEALRRDILSLDASS